MTFCFPTNWLQAFVISLVPPRVLLGPVLEITPKAFFCNRFLIFATLGYYLALGFSFLQHYSPVWLPGFRLVKRIVKYLAKEWSEQKVLVTKVVGLYSIYQKHKLIGALTLTGVEKNGLEFLLKTLQDSKHFFYE